MAYDDYQDIMGLARPLSKRHPMSVANRAKQFAPFAALSGYDSEVRKKEILYDERKILSEEKKDELDRKIFLLKPGIRLRVNWFKESMLYPGKGQHEQTEGEVAFFDPSIYLRIEDTEIHISDICDMEIL